MHTYKSIRWWIRDWYFRFRFRREERRGRVFRVNSQRPASGRTLHQDYGDILEQTDEGIIPKESRWSARRTSRGRKRNGARWGRSLVEPLECSNVLHANLVKTNCGRTYSLWIWNELRDTSEEWEKSQRTDGLALSRDLRRASNVPLFLHLANILRKNSRCQLVRDAWDSYRTNILGNCLRFYSGMRSGRLSANPAGETPIRTCEETSFAVLLP